MERAILDKNCSATLRATLVRHGTSRGRSVSITYADFLRPRPRFKEELRRTISAWGEEAQATIARLRIGIVGAGSVGTIIAEALARTGIAQVMLIDFDGVERLNFDRMLHATSAAARRGDSKVSSLARGIRKMKLRGLAKVDWLSSSRARRTT
jgi:tRNA A37 threonylcarbamoyladenosine dehydratase